MREEKLEGDLKRGAWRGRRGRKDQEEWDREEILL